MIMEDAAMMEVPPNVGMEMGATMASAGPPDGMSFGGGSAKMARAGVTDNHYHGVGGRTADIPPVAAGEDRMIIMTGNIGEWRKMRSFFAVLYSNCGVVVVVVVVVETVIDVCECHVDLL